jgi:hypothetical protein
MAVVLESAGWSPPSCNLRPTPNPDKPCLKEAMRARHFAHGPAHLTRQPRPERDLLARVPLALPLMRSATRGGAAARPRRRASRDIPRPATLERAELKTPTTGAAAKSRNCPKILQFPPPSWNVGHPGDKTASDDGGDYSDQPATHACATWWLPRLPYVSSAMSMGPPAEGCCHGHGTTWVASCWTTSL